MRLRGLHEFLDIYFNSGKFLNSKSDKETYLAIRDSLKIIGESINTRNLKVIEEYIHNKECREITKKFLENFKKLFYLNYGDFFYNLEFLSWIIKVKRGELSTGRRGIQIPFLCLIDNKKSELIVFAFSAQPPGNMIKESEVLKTVLKEFSIAELFQKKIKKIIYWELNSCREILIDYDKIKLIPKESLIKIMNKI